MIDKDGNMVSQIVIHAIWEEILIETILRNPIIYILHDYSFIQILSCDVVAKRFCYIKILIIQW